MTLADILTRFRTRSSRKLKMRSQLMCLLGQAVLRGSSSAAILRRTSRVRRTRSASVRREKRHLQAVLERSVRGVGERCEDVRQTVERGGQAGGAAERQKKRTAGGAKRRGRT